MKNSNSPALKAIALFIILWALLSIAISLPHLYVGPEEKAEEVKMGGAGSSAGVSEGSGDFLTAIYLVFVWSLIGLLVLYTIIAVLKKDSDYFKALLGIFLLTLVLSGIIIIGASMSGEVARKESPDVQQEVSGGGGTANITVSDRSSETGQYAVLAVIAVFLAVITGKILLSFYARRTQKVESQGEELLRKMDTAIRKLGEGEDINEVIIRCYEEMCRVLRKSGVRDRDYFTPREFENAIISQMEINPGPVGRLTSLFEEAKYSSHPIDNSKRRDAINALKELKKEVERSMEKDEGESSISNKGAVKA